MSRCRCQYCQSMGSLRQAVREGIIEPCSKMNLKAAGDKNWLVVTYTTEWFTRGWKLQVWTVTSQHTTERDALNAITRLNRKYESTRVSPHYLVERRVFDKHYRPLPRYRDDEVSDDQFMTHSYS